MEDVLSTRLTRRPAAQEPRPMPDINMDKTAETTGVVTPNCAIARRSQTSSYKMLQKPERRKKTKYQVTRIILVRRYGPQSEKEH